MARPAILLGLLLFAGAAAPPPTVPPPTLPPVCGDWFTEDHQGVIRIAPCGAGYCGTIVGLSDFGPDYRGQSQCHEILIRTRAPQEDGRMPGTVMDPRDGYVYKALLWLGADGAVRLRGFVALPMLGSTQRWEHFAGRIGADCHFRASP